MTKHEVNRNAVDGEFVSADYAKEHPDTTVTETVNTREKVKHDPNVGKIVHYVSYGTPGGEYHSQCRAAMITEIQVEEDGSSKVSLAVINPTGMFFNEKVEFSQTMRGGTWHYAMR